MQGIEYVGPGGETIRGHIIFVSDRSFIFKVTELNYDSVIYSVDSRHTMSDVYLMNNSARPLGLGWHTYDIPDPNDILK